MRYFAIILALLLSACASPEYTQYTATQQAIAASRAQADTARYQALASIASRGDSAASVAAAMALAMGGQSQAPQIAPPQASQALQWAQVLVPGITQVYAIGKSADVAINSSNNAALTSANTMAAFVGVAGKIQAPVVTTPQANVSTTTTTSTDSHNTASTASTVGDTLSGTGVLGSGTYSTQANPVTTTTSTPIVVPDVIQITPVVVPDVVQITPVVTP